MQSLDDQCQATGKDLTTVSRSDCLTLAPRLASNGPADPASSTARRNVLRACVRARGALLNLRLRDASRAIGEMQGMLSAGNRALRIRYEPVLAALRAALL